MTLSVRLLLSFLIVAAVASAQPVIFKGGVLNGASARQGLPNPAVAPGSIFVITGQNLGPADMARAGDPPFPNQVGGTSVQVSSGGATLDAAVIYASATEVAAILPSNTPTGSATAVVSAGGQASAPASFNVAPASFGSFTLNNQDNGPDIFRNFTTQGVLLVSDLADLAASGQSFNLWGTGLGADLDADVQVLIDDKPARVVSKSHADCCPGLDRIVFAVPDGLDGCNLPVTVKTGDVANVVSAISVGSGRFCPLQNGFSRDDIEKARVQGSLKTGYIFLLRFVDADSSLAADIGFANFSRVTYDQIRTFRGNTNQAIPGVCYAANTDGRRQTLPAGGLPGFDFFEGFYPFGLDPLDAGPSVNLSGPGGQQHMDRASPGIYFGPFINFQDPTKSFLAPGSYSLDNGSGGPDVPGFQAKVDIAPAITWTNAASFSSLSRSSDLTITWTGGGPNDRVLVYGFSYNLADLLNASAGIVACTEQARKGRLVIPGSLLSQLPAGSGQFGSSGLLFYGLSVSNRFQPSDGLDAGYVLGLSFSGKVATIQ